ncbi:MAG TPA: protein kinase [Candidatus Acidoferrales bacterium]|nr:protein kinase [Candidatus Acidoferrales bacterium]
MTTLAQYIEKVRLTEGEALKLAADLAETLRRLHDRCEVHGALTPETVELTESGLELIPAPHGAQAVTRYTAPEVVHGQEADRRSDIFSFGAILFELVTGERAFAEDTVSSPAPTSGNPAVDRVVCSCLEKNPDARMPRMQRVILELKLLAVAVQRTETAAALHREKASSDAVRFEMQDLAGRLEERMALQLQAHEDAVADLQRSTVEAVAQLKEQFSVLQSELGATHEVLADLTAQPEQKIEAASANVLDYVNRGFQRLEERIAAIERGNAEGARSAQQFEQIVSAYLKKVDENLMSQSAAIETAQSAIAQTEDLVERVVEALESLQTAVLDSDGAAREKIGVSVN